MRFHSFDEMISYHADRAPLAPALLYGRERIPFAKLRENVRKRAAQLAASGKTCEGILTDGSADCVTEIFAAVRAGLQVVLLDENTPDGPLREQIRSGDADLLWGDPELREEMADALTGGVPGGADRILFFTSGTTDRSKAVVLTQQSLMASAYNGSALLPLSEEDRLLCMLPLSHVFGFVCGLLWGLSCGACVALGRGARHYADDCAFYEPTALSAVPLLWGFLLKNRALGPRLRLVLIGAWDCPAPLLAAARQLGIRRSFGYGLTETSSGIALSLGDDPYAMTVCPDDEVRIAPDGEILVKAPTCVMQGYYKDPESTAAAFDAGWLKTGDLGRTGPDGRLFVTGRKKEMLVLPDGTKIFLPEYEAALSARLGTEELAVGLGPDGRLCLVLGEWKGGDERTVLETIRPVMEQQPRGRQIARVRLEPGPLPRTATGKRRRWEIRFD